MKLPSKRNMTLSNKEVKLWTIGAFSSEGGFVKFWRDALQPSQATSRIRSVLPFSCQLPLNRVGKAASEECSLS
eukprot:3381801-Amphidinium_carterae.1